MRSLRLNEQRASFTINWQLFPTSDVNGLPSAFWGPDSLQPKDKNLQTAEPPWATVSCLRKPRWGCVGGLLLRRSQGRHNYYITLPFSSWNYQQACERLLQVPPLRAKDNQRFDHSYIGFSLFVYPKSNRRAARGISNPFTEIDHSSVKENDLLVRNEEKPLWPKLL